MELSKLVYLIRVILGLISVTDNTLLTLICYVWHTGLTRSRPGLVLLQPALSGVGPGQPAFAESHSPGHDCPGPCSGTSVLTQYGRAGKKGQLDVHFPVTM